MKLKVKKINFETGNAKDVVLNIKDAQDLGQKAGERVFINLNFEVEFPEQIKVMRGTLKKQIYSLKPNENMKWEINLKPLEAGDYNIKIKTRFNDPDQNNIEDINEFPFSIKL